MPSFAPSDSDVVVYTGIFGGYDTLIDPDIVEPDIEYVCFTDDPDLTSEIWEVIVLDLDYGPMLSNRYVKTHPHEFFPDYEFSVYVDGNIQIREPIMTKTKELLSTQNFAVYTHPENNSVSEEVEIIIERGLVEEPTARAQIEAYQEMGFPDAEGLSTNRVLYRRHNSEEIRVVMEEWWSEITTRTPRDQISLMYVLWKYAVGYNLIPISVWQSDTYKIHPHKPDYCPKSVWSYWVGIRKNRHESNIANAIFHIGRAGHILTNEGPLSLFEKLMRKVGNMVRAWVLVYGDNFGIIGPNNIYSKEYYSKRQEDPFRKECNHISDVLIEEFDPDTVIDFGCAIGTYLERFYENGSEIKGVEGHESAFEFAVVPINFLDHHDLRNPYRTEKTYDLVLSIEVAEHIPEKYADTFVGTLAEAGDTVVMTAAPPDQGGTHHVNEKPKSYWKELMSQNGMRFDPDTTRLLKGKISVDYLSHVPQNLMVFRSRTS